MYGKIFECCFTGSMMGAGADVFAVWAYALANCETHDNNKVGVVELNPPHIAALIGMTPEGVDGALEFLCAPDKYSRSPDEEGRRLTHEGAFTYRIVNFSKYNEMRNREERRIQNREAQRRKREKMTVSICQQPSAPSAHTDTDTDTDTDKKIKGVGHARKARTTRLADDEFITALKTNPAYSGIDIDRELFKLDAWMLTPKGAGKQKTRGRILNWLNKCDRPITTGTKKKSAGRCARCDKVATMAVGNEWLCGEHFMER